MHTHFTPFPILETERLILRPLELSDAAAIFSHRADDIVNTYLEDFRHASIDDSLAFINRVQGEIALGKTIMWVLSRKGDPQFMGTICFWNISQAGAKAETGYILASPFHRMGYMQEALVKVIDYGFNTMQLKTIDAYTHEHNSNSIQLLLRNNFKQGIPQKEVSNNRIYFSLSRDANR